MTTQEYLGLYERAAAADRLALLEALRPLCRMTLFDLRALAAGAGVRYCPRGRGALVLRLSGRVLERHDTYRRVQLGLGRVS